MKALKILITGIFFITIRLYAIEPAVLKCISVDDVGNATLTWTPINNLAEFSSYEIYTSTSFTGPYTMIQSITSMPQNTFLHSGAAADIVRRYYFVKTVGLTSQSFSDTLSTILLQLTNPGNGNANLVWNTPGAGYPPAVGSSWYQIQRGFPSGTMFVVDSTQSLTYIDTIALCAAQLEYQIVIEHDGCQSTSAPKEDFFRDVIPPAIPILDTVSVSFVDDSVKIGWNPSSSTDTEGYIVYKFISGIWSVLDTVWGINNTIYSYLDADVQTQSQSYRIAALDSCKNASPLGDIHKTLILQYQVAQCQSSVDIQWNEYENIPTGNFEYLIYVSRDGGDYTLEGQVPSTQLNYTINGLVDSVKYCIFVAVKANNGFTASSAVTCFVYYMWEVPKFFFIRYADVNDEQFVDVAIHVDNSVDFTSISFYKQNETGSFVLLSTLPTNGTNFYKITDTQVQTERYSYAYKAILTDKCGHPSLETDTVGTILLKAKSYEDNTGKLWWTPYSDFAGGVDGYEINRACQPDYSFLTAGTTDDATFEYIDDLFPVNNTGAQFYYNVAAVQASNIYGLNDRSRSNKVRLVQESNTFIPNAFTPGKKNPIFKPENIFVDSENYSFSIYTRWGAQVFTTNNPNLGWDGTYNGSLLDGGTYVYYIRYFVDSGTWIEKSGTVLLIR